MSLVEIPASYRADWKERRAESLSRIRAAAVPDSGLHSPREHRLLALKAAAQAERQRQEETRMAEAAAIAERIAYNPLPKPTKLTIADIQKAVCSRFHISMAEIKGRQRMASVVRPRQIAMYLAKTLTGNSLPEIGRRFGGRDHSTALHAIRKISALLERDRELVRLLGEMEAGLSAAAGQQTEE